MKRIIEEVLQAEAEVKTRLAEARDKAAQVKRQVEKETLEQMNQGKAAAQELMQSILKEAQQEAEQLRTEKLQQADREQETLLGSNSDTVNQLIDAICDLVISTKGKKDVP